MHRRALFVLTIVAIAIADRDVSAQVNIELNLGWNPGLQDRSERVEATSLDGGPMLGGAAFPVDFRQDDRSHRTGIRILTERATADYPSPDPHTWSHRSTLAMIDYERLIWEKPAAQHPAHAR
jgi:hypothetical protein